MSMDSTRKQWVLETVDRLRQRKARPDLERISRMVERFHGLTYPETKESLDSLVEDGTVIKVHFKGNVSYRHIKRPNKQPNESPTHKYDTTSRILMGIKGIMKETGDGVSVEDLERWLISKDPNTRLVKHRLLIALSREIETGCVTKLPDNCYVLTESLPKERKIQERPTCNMKPTTEKPVKPPEVEKEKNVEQSTKSEELTRKVSKGVKTKEPKDIKNKESKDIKTSNEEIEQPRRGRPLSKRKKFKKTHGPDFENPLEIKTKLPGKDKTEDGEKEEEGEKKEEEEGEPTCAFCSKTAQFNPLLICMDCNVKAHPACMDYSPELARRALNSPWQCMDCKMCCMCDGAENADLMLFCDACDKGYHMTCHQPSLTNKPKGKWVCFACKKNVNKSSTVEPKIEPSEKVEDITRSKRGRKRKGSSPPSPKSSKVARSESVRSESVKSEMTSSEDGIKSEPSEPAQADISGNTNGTTCLLTPSASPRPSDTFDYEMRMSQCGMTTFPLTEDNTTYSDATDWNIQDVAKFFEECGFKEEAQVFSDQEVDGKSLLLMRREDVISGLGLKLGPAVKIYKKIVRLQQYSQAMLYS